MLGDSCDDLRPFLADGLCAPARRRYRAHLGWCHRCQRHLVARMVENSEPSWREVAGSMARDLVSVGAFVAWLAIVDAAEWAAGKVTRG